MGRLLYDESNLPEISSLKALDYDTVDKSTIEPIKRVGVLTSGGDAPGMNAAIRSVVRARSLERRDQAARRQKRIRDAAARRYIPYDSQITDFHD